KGHSLPTAPPTGTTAFSFPISGTGVVTTKKAGLWTDSRYWTQAERQMDCNWELQKIVWTDSIGEWLLQEIPAGENIGLDPFLFSIDLWNSYARVLQGSSRILVPIEDNLVDLVWGTQRPLSPTSEIYLLPETFTGSTWQEKVSGIRRQMEQHSRSPTAVLLSALEETAWLFNLRGDDISYNPVFYSYALLTTSDISLFVDRSRLSAEALQSLSAQCPGPLCVQVKEYDQVRARVQTYAQGDVRVWIGTEYTTYGLYRVIPQDKLVESSYSPVMTTKAVKNAKEQTLLRAAHVRDAVAVIQYLLWLEKNVPKGSVDEFSGARYVDKLRRSPGNSHSRPYGTLTRPPSWTESVSGAHAPHEPLVTREGVALCWSGSTQRSPTTGTNRAASPGMGSVPLGRALAPSTTGTSPPLTAHGTRNLSASRAGDRTAPGVGPR
uniref:X-prolyl aminopeptidase 2 n=1 Tax=Chelydra serpentina TaxID=8475 RepID=A0A8C3XQB8_CHESE